MSCPAQDAARPGAAPVMFLAVICLAVGCATVPQNRRQYLADPTMQVVDDPLEDRAMRKMFTSREGAAGGDAQAAGGGCGCGN